MVLLSMNYNFRTWKPSTKFSKYNYGVWIDLSYLWVIWSDLEWSWNCDSQKETNSTRQIRYNQQRNKCTQELFQNSLPQHNISTLRSFCRRFTILWGYDLSFCLSKIALLIVYFYSYIFNRIFHHMIYKFLNRTKEDKASKHCRTVRILW